MVELFTPVGDELHVSLQEAATNGALAFEGSTGAAIVLRQDPDSVDVARFSRKGQPALLSFGAGPHFCLGAALARMTLQESVLAVIASDVDVKLTEDPETLPWRSVLGRSPARLPVAIT